MKQTQNIWENLILLGTPWATAPLTEAMLQHTHNHAINVADALRFRPISDETKSKYYDLFKQGHSPSSAHLKYETNLMYQHDPQLLAD